MGRIRFLGIATAGSLAHRAFPAWMRDRGLDVALEGVDLPAGAPAGAYRRFVQELRDDPGVRGAVITGHKVGVHAAARDLLTPADDYVDLLGEVNAIAAPGLTAHARDVDAVAALLPTLRPFTEALVLGAGGAGAAIALALLRDPAGRVAVTEARPQRLAALAALPELARADLLPARAGEERLARLAPAALVVNATGLGKDAPGSPVAGRFPPDAVVWDVNYRGELPFLATARAQGGLRVHDGFEYFLHGWAQALGAILGVPFDPAGLREAAAAAR